MRTPRLLNFSHGRNSISFPRFPNSHGIISFADPHLLNPARSYRYKKHRGRGVALNIQTCKCAVCAFFASRLGLRDIPDGVAGPSNLPTRTILLSPLRIPRRMRILSDHRESKGSSPRSSRFSLDL